MAATLDITPAHVRINGKTWAKARVVVSDGHVHIFGMIRGTPTLLASGTVTDCVPCNGGMLNVISTDDGEKYDVRRGGCSCGTTKQLASVDWQALVP